MIPTRCTSPLTDRPDSLPCLTCLLYRLLNINPSSSIAPLLARISVFLTLYAASQAATTFNKRGTQPLSRSSTYNPIPGRCVTRYTSRYRAVARAKQIIIRAYQERHIPQELANMAFSGAGLRSHDHTARQGATASQRSVSYTARTQSDGMC